VPHVILAGDVTIDRARSVFEPFLARDGDRVIKAERFYSERDGRAALVEMVVVERGFTQKFFVQLAPRRDGLTVRLEPLTDPEKTPGVKRAITEVAHRLVRATGCVIAGTNIEDEQIR